MNRKINMAFWISLFLLISMALMNAIGQELNVKEGKASWYGTYEHGRRTANGEIYNKHALTAACNHVPFNTIVHVIDLKDGDSVNVRINDRGPFVCKEKVGNKCTKWIKHPTRVIDLSKAAMIQLDPTLKLGVIKVQLTWKEN